MKLVKNICDYRSQKQFIYKNDPRFNIIDSTCEKSKNLYNVALLELLMRLEYQIFPKKLEARNIVRTFPEFHSINTRISNYVVFQAYDVVYSYVKSIKEYKRNPKKFTGEPMLPRLKRYDGQRNKISLDKETFAKKTKDDITSYKNAIENNKIFIRALGINIDVNTEHNIRQISIFKSKNKYVISTIREKVINQNNNSNSNSNSNINSNIVLNPEYYLSIDLGVQNLMAITSNKPGFHPILVKGNHLIEIIKNQIEFKRNKNSHNEDSKIRLRHKKSSWDNFDNKKRDILYKLAHKVKNLCLQNNIGNIVIGNNINWKQHSYFKNCNRIGHSDLIDKIKNLCVDFGINVKTREESYTSKCSFLDLEDIKKHNTYLGKRPKRGLFISSDGFHMNADINGSYNILRKEIGDRWVILSSSFSSNVNNKINITRVHHKDYTANPIIISTRQLVDIRYRP